MERERAGNRKGPEPPRGNIHPSAAPVDLGYREPNASTVYVGNISRDASEMEVLELFNSVDGVYGNREPNIVMAVNFVYDNGNFLGQAYLLYSTVALANFVVQRCMIGNCAADHSGCSSRPTASTQATSGVGTSLATRGVVSAFGTARP